VNVHEPSVCSVAVVEICRSGLGFSDLGEEGRVVFAQAKLFIYEGSPVGGTARVRERPLS
jgi:hypothetical protein